MARRLSVAVAALFCIAMAGCATSSPGPSPFVIGSNAPTRTVAVPAGNFFGLAWLSDGTIVVGHTVDLHPWIGSTQVWQLQPDGGRFARLPLPDDPSCRVTEYLYPTALGDGRVGLLKRCHDPKGAPSSDPVDDFGVAYAIKSGRLEVLTPALNHYPTAISWDPSLTHAVAAESSGIVASIFEIDRQETRLFHVPIRDGSRVFWLDDYFHSDLTDDVQVARSGRADAPAWSPDGHTVAFLAEARSIGRTGFSRGDVPFDLYLMSPNGGNLRRVLPQTDGAGPAWSPDSRYIAFGRQSGTWIYRVGSDKAVRIASESLASLAWSPDGRSLAGIRSLHNDDNQYQIVILDLAGAIVAHT